MPSASRFGALVAAIAVFFPTPSGAQTAPAPAPDPVAMSLFRRGRELVAAGDWDGGCAKFEQSYAREASAGTLLNLARCDEHRGKIASAWARHYQVIPMAERLTDAARRDELVRVARDGIRRLEPRLPKLRITPRGAFPALTVTDASGRSLPVGEEIPFDPGPSALSARADGYRDATYTVDLAEGRTTVLEIALEATPSPQPASPSPPSPPAPTSPEAALPRPTAQPASPPPAWLAWGLGALGVSLGGVAVAFGVDAANANSTLTTRCGSDLRCQDPTFDPSDLNARKDRGFALALGLGAAGALSLGAALWIALTPHRSATPVVLLPSFGDTRVRVSF